MSERALTKPQIISELTKSPHGKLADYTPIGERACREDPEFFAHLLAWNHDRGAVRDAKTALPVIALAHTTDPVFRENAVAHLAKLDPRSLVKALDFAREVKAPSRLLRRLVERYLRDREADWSVWEKTALQHRRTLKTLYARYHIARPAHQGLILFQGERSVRRGRAVPKNRVLVGKFAILRLLSQASPVEAAGLIAEHQIPFLIARGVLGKRAKDPDLLLALINRMTPAELVTNTKALERLGVKTVPALRAAFEAGLQRLATAGPSLKTSKAAAAVADDPQLSEKLKAAQERQLTKAATIAGRWLVLADKSGSMTATIETGRQVSAILARLVQDQVHLIFFDTAPRYVEATGLSYEALKDLSRGIMAGGSTSIGCGLVYMIDRKIAVDGIAIVSDGGENVSPNFVPAYERYKRLFGEEPTVYFYRMTGDPDRLSGECQRAGIDLQTFDLGASVDYYSLPNLVSTMRVARYALLDEILAQPLKTLDEVLTRTTTMEVIRHA